MFKKYTPFSHTNKYRKLFSEYTSCKYNKFETPIVSPFLASFITSCLTSSLVISTVKQSRDTLYLELREIKNEIKNLKSK